MDGLKRDPRGSLAYWNCWTEFTQSSIDSKWRQVRAGIENEAYKPQFIFEIARRHADLMLYQYSRGDDTQAISAGFEGLLDAWEESDRFGADVWDEETLDLRRSWSKNIDFYNFSFRLVGIAILLEIPDVQWERLLALIENEGEDAILDSVISGRSPERVIGSRICFPRAYAKLHSVFLAEPAERSSLLVEYLDGWFKGLDGAGSAELDRAFRTPYWWKLCADEEFGMKGGYFGCWCVEASVVAKVLEIDDTACLMHPNYPGDLLMDGRSTRYADVASPFEVVVGFEAKSATKKNGWIARLLGKK